MLAKNQMTLTIMVLFFSFPIFPQFKWEWQNPLPIGTDLFVVIPLSFNRAIITGGIQTLMLTEDGGQSWHIQKFPKGSWIRQYSFISEFEGWVVAHCFGSPPKLFKTYDGGMTWEELPFSIDVDFSKYKIDGIDFIDHRKGFLLANSSSSMPSEPCPSRVYKTENGGLHWTLMDIATDRTYFQIQYNDSLTGFLLYRPTGMSKTKLDRTVDGGKTWTTVIDSSAGSVHFINNRIGWSGRWKTTDGGETWHYQSFHFPALGHSISKIQFTDSLIGYAISYKAILKTQDGGNTWVIQAETKNGLLTDINFYNAQIGYVCGYGGTIYRTHDGGENWIRCGEGVTVDLFDADFIDQNTGWVVGAEGTVLHTKNGGNTWEKLILPEECDSLGFGAVDFVDREKGWIAGEKYILRTENGGEDWQLSLQVEGEEGHSYFFDIKFLNENTGFAVGGAGFYKTMDGGKNWEKIDTGGSSCFYEIHFIDPNYGWICSPGILLSTKDGGNHWERQDYIGSCVHIQFTDYDHGWMSEEDGAIYRTMNGGKTWMQIPYENLFNELVHSFFFVNNNQGIVSCFSKILISEDGGLHWSFVEDLPVFKLNKIVFVHDTLGWAVGSHGAILKFQGKLFTGQNSVELVEDSQNPYGMISNYPNPFNRETTIHFFLSKPQQVKISVYDILGQCIHQFPIVFGNKGKNEIRWQAENIASGVYFIKIQCLEFKKTITCLYVK